MKITLTRRVDILLAYYEKWGDPDHSEAKADAVVADVMKCWNARTREGRIAAFETWGDPWEAAKFWLNMKRKTLKDKR